MNFKNLITSLLLFACIGFFTACNPDKDNELVTSHHKTVNGFDEMCSKISGNITIQQGATFKVDIKGDKDIVPHIVATEKDNKLTIEYKDKFLIGVHHKVNVYITLPMIHQIELLGSGDILIKDSFYKIKDLKVNLAGSGNVNITAYNNPQGQLSVKIKGSGAVNIEKGQAAKAEIEILGSGSLNAASFEVEDADIDLFGSGNVKITVNQNLDSKLLGSGNIYYSGNPKLDTKILGSGRVLPL